MNLGPHIETWQVEPLDLPIPSPTPTMPEPAEVPA